MIWQHGDSMRFSRLVDWWCFCICKSLQALTKTHAWQHGDAMRCYRLVDWWRFCICKRSQAVYKTHACDDTTAMRCVALGWLIDEAFVFVKCLQADYLYTRMRWQHGRFVPQTQKSPNPDLSFMPSNQSTESPIFDAPFWSENGFRARMNEINRGFRALLQTSRRQLTPNFGRIFGSVASINCAISEPPT